MDIREGILRLNLASVEVGDHRHLDELPGAPAPGSMAWFPILTAVARELLTLDGRWTVSLPLGLSREVPRTAPMIADLVSGLDQSSLMEPPYVFRNGPIEAGREWQGELYEWTLAKYAEGWEVAMSYARSQREIEYGEPYYVRLDWVRLRRDA